MLLPGAHAGNAPGGSGSVSARPGISVVLNGEARELPPGTTVAAAVAAAGAADGGRGVAVAVDGEVVPRGAWEGTGVEDGQRIEVVRAVGGG